MPNRSAIIAGGYRNWCGDGRAAGAHAPGERFVLIEAESLLVWDAPLSALGGTARLMASGVGDAVPAEASVAIAGEALRPPAPSQFVARRQADGGFALGWSRGSRAGWRWIDGIDAPLGEEREAYRLSFTRGDGMGRMVELGSAAYTYGAAEVAADRLAGSAVKLTLVQVGTHAVSRPAQLILQLD